MKYYTGEMVQRGDRVLLDKDAGVIELIVDSTSEDRESRWYYENHGKGVMISQIERLGSVFDNPEEDPSLKFVGRALSSNAEDSESNH
jgi:hypothetical protein